MASLVGTYTFGNAYTLEIKTANDGTGELTGSVTTPTETLKVDGHYHFYKNSGPATAIYINGRLDSQGSVSEDVYESWAGWTSNTDYQEIKVIGGRAVVTGPNQARVDESPVTQFVRSK